MMRVWQVCICCWAIFSLAGAEERPVGGYREPVIQRVVLDDELGMLEREREEYAGNLAAFMSNHLAGKPRPGQADYDLARKVLALALHLSPRNRRAVVLNFQLRKGHVPGKVEGDYEPAVLARLLLTRAEHLFSQKGAGNRLVARCFVELAAQIDPRNEDAVYAYEMQRVDYGALDWTQLTDARRKK
ncbi:MAG: hypothetical protein ACQKBY_04105 [Verrucomicrobiales bacterium]